MPTNVSAGWAMAVGVVGLIGNSVVNSKAIEKRRLAGIGRAGHSSLYRKQLLSSPANNKLGKRCPHCPSKITS